MVFSDTTNKNGIIQRCEFWAGLGDAGISGDATLLKIWTGLINTAYHSTIAAILKAQDEWDWDDPNHADTGFIKTFDLTASQQYVDLTLTAKILKVKRVELKIDGTNWYKAEPIDVNEIDFAVNDTTLIASHFTSSNPYYDQHGRYLFTYPIAQSNVTGGVKVWVTREVDEFTTADTTQEPGIDEPFHELIPLKASLDWALQKRLDNKAEIAAKAAKVEADMMMFYGKKNDDRMMTFKGYHEDYA